MDSVSTFALIAGLGWASGMRLKYPLLLLAALALCIAAAAWLLPRLWSGIRRLVGRISGLQAPRPGG